MVWNVIPEWGKRAPLLVECNGLRVQRPTRSPDAHLGLDASPLDLSSRVPPPVPGLFPIGFSFSTKAYIDGAVSANPGNKSYKQYHFDGGELLGPMPDFGKGF